MLKHKGFNKEFNVKMIKDYHDHHKYIFALVDRIKSYQNIHGSTKKLLLSFHGIPKSYIAEDEPYQEQCFKTAQLVVNSLKLSKEKYDVVFQSRFGKAEWIQPYLAETLQSLPSSGIDDIQVFCPGFVSDCLETIEEIGDESKELFLESGGKKFNYISCLNGDEKFIDMLEFLINNREELEINYTSLL